MTMTIRFPKTVNIDWNYFIPNKSSILADTTVKDELALGTLMKTVYDTKEYVGTTSSSSIDTYLENFYDLPSISESNVNTANSRFQAKLALTLYPEPATYTSNIDFNEET